ncbi:MAG: glycosyltransferase family protein [Deltaproteobacteria bacterium]|nr:glycosyltransferase family protein [Deltaproteobacteria bacterium]
MNVAVVVQARSGSSRLPNKVLAEVAGAPVLVRMLERVLAATTPSTVVLATTTDPSDDLIVGLGARAGVRVERGHPLDLLDRHVQAARAVGADAVVKIPSDCPLIDPGVIDHVIGAFLAEPGRYDFVSNLHPATWPDGNDVEVMTMAALETAHREATRPLEREHTTPFLWDNPERFRCHNVAWETGLDFSKSHRLVLDYAEDLALIRSVYDALWSPTRHFTLGDILQLLEARPELRALNAAHLDYTWYRNHPGELRTISQ